MNALSLQLSVLDDLLERTLSSTVLLEEIRNAWSLLPDDDRLWKEWFAKACSRVRSVKALRTERELRVALANGCGLLAVLTVPDLIRGVLLLGAAHKLTESDFEAFLENRWQDGSKSERLAILRWLSHLPHPERLLSIAREIAREGSDDEFEALACENAYPARFFDTGELNEILRRALDLGLSLRRIEGLSPKTPAEDRMEHRPLLQITEPC